MPLHYVCLLELFNRFVRLFNALMSLAAVNDFYTFWIETESSDHMQNRLFFGWIKTVCLLCEEQQNKTRQRKKALYHLLLARENYFLFYFHFFHWIKRFTFFFILSSFYWLNTWWWYLDLFAKKKARMITVFLFQWWGVFFSCSQNSG